MTKMQYDPFQQEKVQEESLITLPHRDDRGARAAASVA